MRNGKFWKFAFFLRFLNRNMYYNVNREEKKKDFIKWLGVNEKVAKVIVWLAIIMGFLILTNAMLDSLGFPNYQINMENIKKLDEHILIEYLIGWAVVYLNFLAITFLIFRIKDFKNLLKYAILYLIVNIIVSLFVNDAIAQLFIIGFVIVFSYLYSNKNKKYILYSIISIIINVIIQSVCYAYKIKYLDFNELGYATKALLSIDYFIIMAMIILVKEIYLKKRGEKGCAEETVDTEYHCSGSENSKTNQKSHKKSHKK